MTVKNQYSFPLISKLVFKLQSTKYFTKLNVYQSFNNIHIKPRNKWKTVFCMNYRISESLVMFFGMNNSPAIFQTMMNNIFQDLIAEGIMIVYLDDILIFIQTLEEYYKTIYKVLEVLAKWKLLLYSKKYKFNK